MKKGVSGAILFGAAVVLGSLAAPAGMFAAAAQSDVYQAQRRLVQDLTSQQAAALVRERKLASARERALLARLDERDQSVRATAGTNDRAQAELDAVIAERDALTREIAKRDRQTEQQIAAYESTIRNMAMSGDPKFTAYLKRFAVGDTAAVDEFVGYARARHDVRQHATDIQFAEQLRVAAAQKNSQRLRGHGTLNDVIPLYEEALRLDPHDTWGGIELARLYARVGEQQKALAVYRSLLPHLPRSRDRMVVLNDMGDAIGDTDPVSALAANREALEIARDIAARNPASFDARDDVAIALEKVGDRLVATDPDAAMKCYREALEIRRALAARFPDQLQVQRDLAGILDRMWNVLSVTDLKAALELYRERLAVTRQFVARDPNDIESLRSALVAFDKLGTVLVRAKLPGAVEIWRKDVAVARALAAADPGDLRAQRDLEVSLQKMGDLTEDTDPLEASKAFQESFEIAQRLSAQQPDNLVYQEDLSLSLSRLGDIRKKSDPGQALVFYRQSLDIARQQAARAPENRDIQRTFAVSLIKIAVMSHKRADILAAKEHADRMKRKKQWLASDEQAYRDLVDMLERAGD